MRRAIAEVRLEALEGKDTADDTGVVGEEEGPHAAERDEVDGPERSQSLGHGRVLSVSAGSNGNKLCRYPTD